MFLNRRWFLTTAGSAFLASISGVLEAAKNSSKGKPSLRKKSGDPKSDEEAVVKSFFDGYSPKMSDDDKRVCRPVLTAMYKERFDHQYPRLSDSDFDQLLKFAAVLGSLTRQCLENEGKGTGGWTKVQNPKLREEHLHRAREILGFVLNKNIRKGVYRVEEQVVPTEGPCPVCPT